jgi:hypothetical protein
LIVSDSGGKDIASDNIEVASLDASSELSTSLNNSVTILVLASENVAAGVTDKDDLVVEVRSDDWTNSRAIARSQDE